LTIDDSRTQRSSRRLSIKFSLEAITNGKSNESLDIYDSESPESVGQQEIRTKQEPQLIIQEPTPKHANDNEALPNLQWN